MRREEAPLIGVWHELVVDEDRVAHLARTVLERQGNEIAESAPGQGVLVGEEAIVLSHAQLMAATHRLGDEVAAELACR
jgi:hypothetical protein